MFSILKGLIKEDSKDPKTLIEDEKNSPKANSKSAKWDFVMIDIEDISSGHPEKKTCDTIAVNISYEHPEDKTWETIAKDITAAPLEDKSCETISKDITAAPLEDKSCETISKDITAERPEDKTWETIAKDITAAAPEDKSCETISKDVTAEHLEEKNCDTRDKSCGIKIKNCSIPTSHISDIESHSVNSLDGSNLKSDDELPPHCCSKVKKSINKCVKPIKKALRFAPNREDEPTSIMKKKVKCRGEVL